MLTKRIHVILPEKEAADLCLRMAEENDLVVITADKIEFVWQQIVAFKRDQPGEGGMQGLQVSHLRAS